MQLIPDEQRRALEQRLASRTADLLAADGSPFGCMVRDFALDGSGKRVRPQLVLWAIERCGGDARGDVALDAACGWELFHAFLLVHDDIIDAAASRRSRPSLHRRLASLDGNSETFGVNLGIVAGDLLFAAAMRLWHSAADDPATPAEIARRVLGVTSRVAMHTGVGQASDIAVGHRPLGDVTETQVLDAYHAKTAAYTFEGPLLTGAILAGLDLGACAPLTRFAVALGQAYQVENDLLDLDAPPRPGSDLLEGKRTLPVIRAYAASGDAGRRALADGLRRASTSSATMPDRLAAASRVRELLVDLGGVSSSADAVQALLASAESAADDPAMPAAMREGLSGLLAALRASYFRPRQTHPTQPAAS